MDCVNVQGNRPLHLAASKGSAAIVEALLEAGADAEGRNQRGSCAVHVAAAMGHADVVHVLINPSLVSARCDPSLFVDDHGLLPLHIASHKGHVDVVKILLTSREARSAVVAVDRFNATALHFAAAAGFFFLSLVGCDMLHISHQP